MPKGPFRAWGPTSPVEITLDGESIAAERGEPVAAALVAAGKVALARSPKFHRPRGPSCMRAACDGCLMRVDGVPNAMTCRLPVEDGMEIHSQNTLGSRRLDLLRVTDWFFPEGMNHHELFAGVPGVQNVMQVFARRVAGLGKLPTAKRKVRPAKRREVDVVVVGSGASGMAIACALEARGRRVVVLDDALAPGGSLRALGADVEGWREIVETFAERVTARKIVMVCPATAAGMYGDDLLVLGPTGARVVTARAIVLAPGAHDGVVPFEGNDLPGVWSARAAGLLLARGVAVGHRVAVFVPPGGGPFGEAFAREAARVAPASRVMLFRGAPDEVHGTAHVRSVRFTEEGAKRSREESVDAVLIDAPRAPAYELCEQAGASLEHRPSGFFPRAEGGRLRGHVWGVGEVVGTPLDPEAVVDEANAVAARIAEG